MRTWIVTMIVAVLAACSGDAPPSSGKCSGAPYDPCNEEHDCTSQFCQNFLDDGFQVCSQPCDETIVCPGDGECDDVTGMCKPAAPNECEL